MALKSRIALALAALVALIAVAVLPPRACSDDDSVSLLRMGACSGWRTQPHTYRNSLAAAHVRLVQTLAVRTLGDSLRQELAHLPSVRSSDGSLIVVYEEPTSADSARAWLRLVVAERDLIPGTGRGRVVISLRSASWRLINEKLTMSGSERQNIPRILRFVSAGSTDTTCFIALRLDMLPPVRFWQERGHGASPPAFLGSCGLASRFGLPGTGMLRAVRWAYGDDRPNYAVDLENSVVRDLEGLRRQRADSTDDYQVAACITGETAACGMILGFGPVDADWQWGLWQAGRTRDLFAHLLQTGDTAAFGRMWRSPLPLEQALAWAYRRPANEIVQDWARRRWLVPAVGPGTNGRTMVATIGWLAAAIVAAAVVGTRRRVGT